MAGLRDDYFSPLMVRRQVLIWVVAARRQLDRWEALVASMLTQSASRRSVIAWEAEVERQLALVAGRHVLRAVRLSGWNHEVDTTPLDVITDLRNVGEHSDESMPVFNVSPQDGDPPRASGRRLAQALPRSNPFSPFEWNSREGAGLPASRLREVLDALEQTVLSIDPSLARFVPPSPESPWLGEGAGSDQWWPREGPRATEPEG